MAVIGRQCVILAGGLGTRLGALVGTAPKPMLPVGGRPFLEHLVRCVHRFGFNHFLILAGYLGDVVAQHFRQNGPLACELGVRFETFIAPVLHSPTSSHP
jgi:NDP-sugar pyrophosphorylase family protein